MREEHERGLRVVLDTNVLLSATVFGGVTAAVWQLVLFRAFDLFVSPFILVELRRILIAKARVPAERADVLVTGNMRDLKSLGEFRGIRILTPREFLRLYLP